MPFTPDEAKAAHARFRAATDTLADALTPDADGKIRVTKAEASKLTTDVLGAALAIIVDLVD